LNRQDAEDVKTSEEREERRKDGETERRETV